MTDPQHPVPNRPPTAQKWAPWWLYLVILLGANYLRSALLPFGTVPEPVVVIIALAQAALLFVVITAIWRASQRGNH